MAQSIPKDYVRDSQDQVYNQARNKEFVDSIISFIYNRLE